MVSKSPKGGDRTLFAPALRRALLDFSGHEAGICSFFTALYTSRLFGVGPLLLGREVISMSCLCFVFVLFVFWFSRLG